jgi:hypothetical protein
MKTQRQGSSAEDVMTISFSLRPRSSGTTLGSLQSTSVEAVTDVVTHRTHCCWP